MLLGKINVNGPTFRVYLYFFRDFERQSWCLHAVAQHHIRPLNVHLIPEIGIDKRLQRLRATFDEDGGRGESAFGTVRGQSASGAVKGNWHNVIAA